MEFSNTGRLAVHILTEAAKLGASDVHVEPLEQEVRVRIRLDGLLQELCRLPWSYYSPLVTQLKVQSGMDIAEKRVPQDGRWQLAVAERSVDLRLSTLPTINGEKVVVRLLDKQNNLLHVEALGLSAANLRLYKAMYTSPNGLVLLTGPTGSGKTTTLYATLQELQGTGLNLVTLEEPVEYRLAGINQVEVNRKVGLTFARRLRALVRQDPDIIMVGEIRDEETAAMAVQAALTGHLVLSTLHTNSAVGAIARLLDMGVAPYLLAASLRGVLSQRLVRRVCPLCATEYMATALEREYLGLKDERKLYHGTSCQHCRGTGYRGRLAVQELLPMDENMASLISGGAAKAAILQQAAKLGRRSLYDDGAAKVLTGVTTVAELLRNGIVKEEDHA